MDPVDQGTLAMLLLGGGMAVFATLYFTVRWFFKRKSKQSAANKYKKRRLKQTFSRFSSVDEELTVQVFHEPTASDRDLIISYCESDRQETPTLTPRAYSVGQKSFPSGPRRQSQASSTPSPEPKIHSISLEVETKLAHTSSQAYRTPYLETDL